MLELTLLQYNHNFLVDFLKLLIIFCINNLNLNATW